jgi:hypothetical protein
MTDTPERRITRTVNMHVRALTAVPIVLICARRHPCHHALVGDQNGGSARVIHSPCCPAGGRPASPRKSHSKSQREAVSGDKGRRSATVGAGQVLSEPSPATPGDAREVTGGQGVAGSNPAVPTGSRIFSNILLAHKSQQKSHLLSKWLFQRPAPIMSPGLLPGHLSIRQSRRNRQSRGQRSLSHLESARQPRQLRTGGHHPRRTG